MEWSNVFRGLVMGATEVVPGVSSGTIAVVLGIYERLIAALNGLFSRNWKRSLGFLIPLGVGMVITVFLFANIIEWLFTNYQQPTLFFFIGLILGVLPYLFYKADAKKDFTVKHYGLMLIGLIVVAALGFLNPNEGGIMENLTAADYMFLFFGGFIASSAMIIPGISGSLMLLMMGAYTTVISAVSNLQLDILLVTGLGIIVGILIMSKIIAFFLRNYYTGTFAIIIGLVIGSAFVIYPGFPADAGPILLCLVTFVFGLLAAYLLGRIEYK